MKNAVCVLLGACVMSRTSMRFASFHASVRPKPSSSSVTASCHVIPTSSVVFTRPSTARMVSGLVATFVVMNTVSIDTPATPRPARMICRALIICPFASEKL